MLKQTGIFIIKHLLSGKRYIGRSNFLRSSITKSLSQLKNNLFENIEFQKDYNEDPRVEVDFTVTSNTEEALDLQRALLSEGSTCGDIYNFFKRNVVVSGLKTEYEIAKTGIIDLDAISYSKLPLCLISNNLYKLPVFKIRYHSKEFGIIKGFGNTIPLFNGIRMPPSVSGLYFLIENDSKSFYIGSSVGLGRRMSQHATHLVKNIHRNKSLQKLFNSSNIKNFEVKFLIFEDDISKDDLLALEQELINLHLENELLLNSSKDTRKFGLGLKFTRTDLQRKRISEYKSKQISCYGKIYTSASIAAIALGLSVSAISAWARSGQDKHKEFFYIEESKK